jgi:hypothetical protein
MNLKSAIRMALVFLLTCTAPSCTSVKIDTYQIPPAAKKLESTNRKRINLESASLGKFSPAGHQFLFFLIPFGRIEIPEPETSVHNKAETKLNLMGYNVNSQHSDGSGTLKITLNKLQLSAYDLFFMRRIYCEIELQTEVYDRDKHLIFSKNAKSAKSSFKSMGFKPQLEHIYQQCLDEAINQALINIY